MKNYLIYPLLTLILMLLTGCDVFDYHPYDGKIKGETNINAKNIELIEKACKGKEVIRFAFISDTQRAYNETENFVKHINKQTGIDFVIHGGDISDFGLTKEFMWMRDIMNRLNIPYVVLLGNHDCLANGEQIYNKIFGKENFSFLAGDIKFICLNTNALEYDYSRPVPDFEFIVNEYMDERKEYKKTVFAMHVRPYSEQFNNNVARVFQRYVKEAKGIQFCLNGHDHHIAIDDLFDDGLMYFGTASAAKRKYIMFTVNEDGYDYEVAEF